MTIELKTRTIPERESEYVSKVKCDLCGKELDNPEVLYRSEIEWGRGHDVIKTCVRLVEGESFDGQVETTHLSFHICPDCFKSKLIPWFENQGAKISSYKFED